MSEEIGKLYEGYFTHKIDNRRPKFGRMRSIIKDSILAAYCGYNGLVGSPLQKRLGKVLSWIGPIRQMVELSVMTLNGQNKGKLLDVGCGNGYFLAKMRELGWKVVGVEPDGQAVKVAKEHFGFDVYEGSLEEVGFPNDTFDAITMNHVIKHVPNPLSTLKECQRILKKGGKLIVVTPNIESIGHRLFGKAYLHLDPPRHLYLFAPGTLRACAERAGLRILKLRTTARSARWMWAVSYLIHRNGSLPGGSPKKQSLWL